MYGWWMVMFLNDIVVLAKNEGIREGTIKNGLIFNFETEGRIKAIG